jgi:hypothetical protein
MVKTPPQQASKQQQQQPAQRQKRKKVVPAITLADPSAATVLEMLSKSVSELSTASKDFEVSRPDERTVGLRTNMLSSKVTA